MFIRSLLLAALCFTYTQAETLFIKGNIRPENAKIIHEIFVQNSGINTHQSPPDRYIVTIGAITDVEADDLTALEEHMNSWIAAKAACLECINFSIDTANCMGEDVAIFGTYITSPIFKTNDGLRNHLKCFRAPSGKKYDFTCQTADYYRPHILVGTMTNTPNDVPADVVIRNLNDRIQEDRLIENCHLFNHPIENVHLIRASQIKPVPQERDRERAPTPVLSDAIFHSNPTDLPKAITTETEPTAAVEEAEKKKD